MLFFLLLIQIIVESLPISSSGHVALIRAFLHKYGYDSTVSEEPFLAVHGITAILMLIVMRRYWMPLLYHPWRTRKLITKMALYGLCAELITAAVYYTLHDVVTSWNLAFGFFITAISLFSVTFYSYNALHRNPFLAWFMTGFAQGLAVIPGCSRLALTYVVARWCGYSGRHAFLLSCTLALPPFIVASLYGSYAFFTTTCYMTFSLAGLLLLLITSYGAYKALLFTWYCMVTNHVYYFAWYVLFMALSLAVYC